MNNSLTQSARTAWRKRPGHQPSSGQRFASLTYHRIAPRNLGTRYEGLISASPHEFATQMQILATKHRVVSITDVLDSHRSGQPLPERAVLLTFDDAVDDFEEHALPSLERYELPSTVFVPTSFCGDSSAWFWWDAVHDAVFRTDNRTEIDTTLGPLTLATDSDRQDSFNHLRTELKRLPFDEVAPFAADLADRLEVTPPPARVMDWPTLRRLESKQVQLCAHTRTHPHLDTISAQRVEEEIVGSLHDLEAQLGKTLPVFAYPSGQYSDVAIEVLRSAGVELAFTTDRGVDDLATSNPLLLKRINVGSRGLGVVRMQMYPSVSAAIRTAQGFKARLR